MNMGYAIVNLRKSVRVPDSVMKKLDIREGDAIQFINEAGEVKLKKVVTQ